VLGVLCGLSAAALAILAIGGHLSWLSSDTDQVSRLHEWLDARVPTLRQW